MSDTDRPLPFETHLGVDIEAEMKEAAAALDFEAAARLRDQLFELKVKTGGPVTSEGGRAAPPRRNSFAGRKR